MSSAVSVHEFEDDSDTLFPPPHPSEDDIAHAPRRYWLFGYPISHSASPAFQNCLLQAAWQLDRHDAHPGTYALCDTLSVSEPHFLDRVRRDERFAGAGVTMPLKVSVTQRLGREHALDELDDIARATGSVNTIVVIPAVQGRRYVGTNTDYLGVRHTLLRAAAIQRGCAPGFYVAQSPAARFPPSERGAPHSAFVVGAGGACRAAILALHDLGLSPIYLLNRDEEEKLEVLAHFKGTVDVRTLHNVEDWDAERSLRAVGDVGPTVVGVGAIPAVVPATDAEKMVYYLAHSFFSETDGIASSAVSESPDEHEILLRKRLFLDMCYKPRLTPLLRTAAENGWVALSGIEAMIEQGLAQARMWAASATLPISTDSESSAARSVLNCATKDGDTGPLGHKIELRARELAVSMYDTDGSGPPLLNATGSVAPLCGLPL